MTEIAAIAVDTAKRVFEVGLFDAEGALVSRKRLTRAQFMRFMDKEAPRVLVGMEASGGVHYWARWLRARGFPVKVMPARVVRAYRVGPHKSDQRDVWAVGEAMVRPHVPSVPVKSERAQTLQALVRVRTRIIRQRVQAAGQMRGLLAEFGIVAPKGVTRFRRFLETLEDRPEWAALPSVSREMFDFLSAELGEIEAREKAADKQLEAAQRGDEDCKRLRSVPSFGAVNAATLAALLEAPELFAGGRKFSSYLGIVPGRDASADRERQRSITKAGPSEARRLLMLAAQSLINMARRRQNAGKPLDRLQAWALGLAERKGRKKRNVAVAAVANKLARIAWAVMARRTYYRAMPFDKPAPQAAASKSV